MASAPVTRQRPRGLPPVLPTHDPSESEQEAAISDAAELILETQANEHNGGLPRAYTSIEGIRIHCAYDEIMDIDSLVSHPLNPNIHPASQIELLAKIILGNDEMQQDSTPEDKRHANGGYRESLTLSRRSGFIIKGHGRRGAALLIKQRTGETAVPIVWQDYANEAEEYADMVADNRIAELSSLDVKQVGALLETVAERFPNFDTSMFAFTPHEITAFSEGWNPTRDPRTAGSTDTTPRSTVKVLCLKASEGEVRQRIAESLTGIEGVSIE